METDNLVALIERLAEHEVTERDSRLEKGQVFASDGSIVTL